MRDRVDRRFALLVGVLLTIASVSLDLALSPPDLGRSSAAPPASASIAPVTVDASARPWPASLDRERLTQERASATPAAPLGGGTPGGLGSD